MTTITTVTHADTPRPFREGDLYENSNYIVMVVENTPWIGRCSQHQSTLFQGIIIHSYTGTDKIGTYLPSLQKHEFSEFRGSVVLTTKETTRNENPNNM